MRLRGSRKVNDFLSDRNAEIFVKEYLQGLCLIREVADSQIAAINTFNLSLL